MDIRRAKLSDIDMLVENRLEFVYSIGNVEDKEAFKRLTREYFQKHLEDNTLLSFIALDNGKIISSCILCIYQTLPTPSCLSGKAGLLLNVYTLREYRRKGLAYNLLSRLIEEAKALGLGKIHLDYTDDGYHLYKKLGFEELHREMALKL
ncbi:GNAT family N-acetyltransferase [Ruminiclostridium herbifermentans]|uniref:GNAT family N-acetyltransferase n=1 Tax=Ruminiclostridium herbifermentans TaxID=2488810 RepID=A0A4U7JMB4_9FIRM|nr:GNAT family N-acetyltransferase [Ruminiclostridium herbifermentans]QNU65411.1 GNAT family N-acetyltransferase [Ruminiclostridium herbifermentans]